MGLFGSWFLGQNTDKLKEMLKERENKIILLKSEIEEIKNEIAERENEDK